MSRYRQIREDKGNHKNVIDGQSHFDNITRKEIGRRRCAEIPINPQTEQAGHARIGGKQGNAFFRADFCDVFFQNAQINKQDRAKNNAEKQPDP